MVVGCWFTAATLDHICGRWLLVCRFNPRQHLWSVAVVFTASTQVHIYARWLLFYRFNPRSHICSVANLDYGLSVALTVLTLLHFGKGSSHLWEVTDSQECTTVPVYYGTRYLNALGNLKKSPVDSQILACSIDSGLLQAKSLTSDGHWTT